MTDQPTPAPADLRQRIAEALMRWAEGNNDPQYAAFRRPATVTKNAYGRADAVLAVVQPELDRLARLAEDRKDRIDDINFARSSLRARIAEQEAETMRQHERAQQAEAAIARVRALHVARSYPNPDAPGQITYCLGCEDATSGHPCNTLAALQPPAPAHDAGPSVTEAKANDRRWPLEKHGE